MLDTQPTEVPERFDPEPERLSPGMSVDHYRVIRFLDRGAMGEVYLARDLKLGRKVALKLIPASRLRSPQAVRDFLFEAKATARFNHPNIIAIYGAGEYDGHPYVALEYVEGRSLRQRMQEDPPSLMETLRIGHAIADALEEAHRHGIVHRDLKPENVLIAKDGRIRLLDFGLALPLQDIDTGDIDPLRETMDLPPPSNGSIPEALRGTPAYMAPEQWLSEEITNKTDIWALGMMLTEMINGEHPHAGASIIERIRAACAPTAPIELVSSEPMPEGPRELIARCMRVEPAKRPDANEVRRRLEDMVQPRRRPTTGEQTPFPGLLPFSERHAEWFFGRNDEVTALIERLRETTVLPIVGPSGSGKTSLIEAGLIPRLEEEGRWLAISVRPGSRPFAVLASQIEALKRTALVKAGDESNSELERALFEEPSRLGMVLHDLAETRARRVLLVIDQLEHLYTQVEDSEERHRFLEAISLAADDPHDPVRVLFAIRNDFLGRVAESRAARKSLSRVFVIRAPNEAMLREVLEKPVADTGYTFEDPAIVDDIVATVRREVSALALLQLTARALWDRRDRERKLIARATYDSLGGVAGVLADHADSVIDGFSPAHARLARNILVRLVTPERTRRSLSTLHVVDGLGAEDEVLERLIGARLVAVKKAEDEREAESKLELAHDSLIAWNRLRDWLDESKVELAFLAEVGAAADLWERRGEPEDELWTGERLEQALGFVARASSDVPMQVIRFLDAGRRKSNRETRRRRRRFLLLGMMLLAAVIAALVVADSFRKKENLARDGLRIAHRERKVARRRLAEALREAASSALAREDRLQARAKIRAALEVEDSAHARALWRTLESDPLVWREELDGPIEDVAISYDGRWIAVVAQDELVRIFDARTRERVLMLGERDQVISTGFSRDGRRLAVGTWSGEVSIWDLETKASEPLGWHEGRVQAVVFSPDGTMLASAGHDGTLRLFDVATRTVRWSPRVSTGRVLTVAFDPSGERLAAAGQDGVVRIFQVKSGALLHMLTGHQGRVFAVAFAPSGDLASAGGDGTIRIWNRSSGAEVARFEGHRGEVRDLVFAPDGERLITAGEDGVLREWHVSSRSPRIIGVHGDRVTSIAIDGRGRYLVAGGLDRTIDLWDTEKKNEWRLSPSGRTLGLEFSPDDRWLAVGSWNKTVRIWDVREGREIQALSGHRGPVFDVAFSPDGKSLASASWDKSVRIWDLTGGVERQVLVGHTQEVSSIAFSPDGRMIASGSWDGTARWWELSEGRSIEIFRHGAPVHDVAISPDGKMLATAGAEGRIRLFDLSRRTLVATLTGHEGPVLGIRFSKDGKELASGGRDGTVRMWTVATGTGRIVDRVDGRIFRVDVHPDGTVGAPTSFGEVRLIGSVKEAIGAHRGAAGFVRFSHDGGLVASAGDDGTVQLFEVETGRRFWRTALLSPSERLLTHRGWSGNAPEEKTAFVEEVQRRAHHADVSLDGKSGAIATRDRIELWNLSLDQKIAEVVTASAATRIAAHRNGVDYELADGSVYRLAPGGTPAFLANARIVGKEADGAILTNDRELFGADWEREVGQGVTAAERGTFGILLGFADGRLTLLERRRMSAPFVERANESAVVRIAVGGDLVAAGYADGTVILRSLERGVRLAEARLHGAISQLSFGSRALIAASELGDSTEIDLDVFRIGYCSLMSRVWSDVPVTWANGRAEHGPPPESHRCGRR